MELLGIINKLVGPIRPSGDHNVDERRLENLKELTCLVESLLFGINEVAQEAKRPEASIKAMGVHAKQFLDEVKSQ